MGDHMTVYITGGWFYLTNGTDSMKVKFSECKADVRMGPTIKHYEGGYNLSYDLEKLWLELKLKDIWFESYSEYETFFKYFISWHQAGTLTIGIYRDTSNNLIEFKGDGNGTTFIMVAPVGIEQAEKISRGDEQKYVIHSLRLEEGG